jgi:hypothetical protein
MWAGRKRASISEADHVSSLRPTAGLDVGQPASVYMTVSRSGDTTSRGAPGRRQC